MKAKTEVFIYALMDPRTAKIRYIGKTNNLNRRYSQHLKGRDDQKMTPARAWIKSLVNQGLKPNMMLIDSCAEDQWHDLERHYIKRFRDEGHDILNMAEGGNQPYCPPEIRKEIGKRSAAIRQKGIWYMLRFFGSAVKEAELSGNEKKAARFRHIMNLVRNAQGEKREKMNAYGLRVMGHG
jgi:hypothetical protein